VDKLALILIFGTLLSVPSVKPEIQESVTQLTKSGARNGQPFISPDNKRISFVSNREDGWEVWLMGINGQNLRRVTREVGPVGWPSWTKDASILFYAQRRGDFRLLRVDLESGHVSQLDDSSLVSFRPLLSPNGKHLLFDAVDPSRPGNHDIYVRDLKTGKMNRLTRDSGYNSDARWSPDGRQIVFHSDRGADPFHTQVYVMSSDGSSPRRVTQGPAKNAYPSWSPNGRCIIYTSENHGNRDLWIMNFSGEDPMRVTKHSGFDSEPVWSPGGRILFSTDRFGGVELAYLTLNRALIRRCED